MDGGTQKIYVVHRFLVFNCCALSSSQFKTREKYMRWVLNSGVAKGTGTVEGFFESPAGSSTGLHHIYKRQLPSFCVALVTLFLRTCGWLQIPSSSPAAQSLSQMLWGESILGSITEGRECATLMPSLFPQIGPSTGSVSANFPHPAFHPCVSTLPLEGPSLEVREEPCLQHQPGPRSVGRWAVVGARVPGPWASGK